ncbi:hypothetical protein DP107_18680 [Haloglomus irregulare]|uniref:Pyrrolo-quinoline quinone repeat domain-containing protein n=1 Tax=Haloglomus irregulare TaxID=2234134 RepID=A0A554MUA6_9EURY|nr:hypothetical protein DP107_18680 [Haloglomus irregulare]
MPCAPRNANCAHQTESNSGPQLYLPSGSRLLAFGTEEGRQQWRVNIESAIRTPPVVAGDTVYIVGETITVLDSTTGEQWWTAEVQQPGVAIPGEAKLALAWNTPKTAPSRHSPGRLWRRRLTRHRNGGDPDAEHGDCGNVCPRVVNTHRRQGRTERVRW